MNAMTKGLVLAGLHIALVLSLGGKLLYDRATRPRVWAKTAPVDPDLPIRGRYVSLRLEADCSQIFPEGAPKETPNQNRWMLAQQTKEVRLDAVNGALVALPSETRTGQRVSSWWTVQGTECTVYEPVAYFIPEHVVDPSRRAAGEELWVEVTLPRKGPPRPIQLGVKKDGNITPVEVR